jgi:hypothetical protein
MSCLSFFYRFMEFISFLHLHYMLLRIFTLLFFMIGPFVSVAQPPAMTWIGGNEHHLGVIFADSADVGSQAIVRDTFRFVNNGNETLQINKLHVSDPEKFGCTRIVAPGDTGVIYYEDTFRNAGEMIKRTVIRLNIQTNYSPWEMVFIDYFTVHWLAEKQYGKNGEPRVVRQRYNGNQQYSELEIHPGGQPAAYGWRSDNKHLRTGVWNFWDVKGNPLNDTIFTKQIRIAVRDHSSQSGRASYKLKAKTQNKWYDPETIASGTLGEIHILAGTDSLVAYNDSTIASVKINFNLISTGSAFELFMMRPGDHYYIQQGVKIPVYYSNDMYGIVWKTSAAIGLTEKAMARTIQQQFPEVTIADLYSDSSTFVIVLPDTVESVKRKLITQISVSPFIEHLSKVFSHHRSGSPVFCRGTGYITIGLNVSEDSVKTLLRSTGFELYSSQQLYYGYELQYRKKVIDETILDGYNRIATTPAFPGSGLNFVTKFVSMLEHPKPPMFNDSR